MSLFPRFLFSLDDDVIHPVWGMGSIYSYSNKTGVGKCLFDDHLEKGAILVNLACLDLLSMQNE